MKAASSGTIALLAGNQFMFCELYVITLSSGVILYYTDADMPISYLGNNYINTTPKIIRDKTKLNVGIEVDNMTVTLYTSASDLIQGISFPNFARNGGFDGAKIQVDRCFMSTYGDTSNGVVNIFTGIITDVVPSRTQVALTVSSNMILLTTPMPRNVYSPSCSHLLYDSGCTMVKSSFGASSSVAAGSTPSIINSSLSQASAYFDMGTITFTSGVNAGVSRTIKSYTIGAINLALPLPVACAIGDTFTAYAGCDKTQTTCTSKFNNVINFRGFPFIPVPEVSM